MALFRVTFGFAGSNTGWTESHMYNNNSIATPSGVFQAAKDVATQRVLMLGYPFAINGIRISTYSFDGVTRSRRTVQLFKGNLSNQAFSPTAGASEPAVVALQASCYAAATAPPLFTGNTKTVFLGAPPIQCLLFAGAGPGNGAVNQAVLNLGANFQLWKQSLLGGSWGWLAVTAIGGPLALTTITQTAGGQLGFTVGNNTLVDGTVYNIRVSGVNQGRSPCNGQFVAVYNATTKTLTTKEIVAFATMQTGGQVQPYNRFLTFVPYGDMILQNFTIKHKRGRPFLSEPGRARKRIRG